MGSKKSINFNIHRYLWISAALLSMMPIIPRGVRPVVIAAFLLLSIFDGLKSKEPFKWKYFIISSSLFIVYLISLLYTEDLAYGFKKIGTAIPLLVFPLSFGLMSMKSIQYILDRKYKLMWLYILATLVLCVGAFIKFNLHYSFNDSILHYVNIIRSRIFGWKIHPIYLSMHICVSLIFSLFIIRKGLDLKKWILLILSGLVLIFFLLIMIKKGPIISLILVGTMLVFLFNNKKLYLAFGGLALIICTTVIFNPKVNNRFAELLQVQNLANNTNSTSIRYSIYDCAGKIIPEAGILGYGIGDGKNKLLECFNGDLMYLAENRYNSHNQYLGLILKVGYVGLICFAFFLFYYLQKAFTSKNYLLVALISFYAIVMLSENILERENGVLYFSFLVNLFIFIGYIEKSRNKLKTKTDNLKHIINSNN